MDVLTLNTDVESMRKAVDYVCCENYKKEKFIYFISKYVYVFWNTTWGGGSLNELGI